jgi:hypothetical protein
MEILFWLLPPVVVTVLASAWVSWIGRTRPVLSERSEAAQERAQQRFAEAILREHPTGNVVRRETRERSTGVAVRSSKSA